MITLTDHPFEPAEALRDFGIALLVGVLILTVATQIPVVGALLRLVVALDAKTGELAWSVNTLIDAERGSRIWRNSSAPPVRPGFSITICPSRRCSAQPCATSRWAEAGATTMITSASSIASPILEVASASPAKVKATWPYR